MVSPVPIFFINLDRREDRAEMLRTSLTSLGLTGIRVQACDARELATNEITSLCSLGEIACWISHTRAMTAGIESGASHFLILEDDAKFTGHPNWEEFLRALIQGMQEKNIDVLQIGFIEHLATFRYLERILSFILARARRDFSFLGEGKHRSRVQMHEFLAGAHAYIVSREAASAISKFNYPVARAADDFLGDLAIRGKNRLGLKFGRLTKSRVSQASRLLQEGVQVDSDTTNF